MRIFLLGISGWISHYLVEALQKRNPDVVLQGSYRSRRPVFDSLNPIELFKADCAESDSLVETVLKTKPDAVVNLISGSGEEAERFHSRLIERLNPGGIHYSYCSSASAFDGEHDRPHHEEDLPKGGSEYGIHKQKCETVLRETSKGFAIFRFGAAHGWSPRGNDRTQEFLEKLKAGEKIPVVDDCYQNPVYALDLGSMMAALVLEKREGVFHLGIEKQVNELSFRRKLAAAFGYDADRVVSEPCEHFDISTLPARIYELYGDEFRRTEEKLLSDLAADSRLAEYLAS